MHYSLWLGTSENVTDGITNPVRRGTSENVTDGITNPVRRVNPVRLRSKAYGWVSAFLPQPTLPALPHQVVVIVSRPHAPGFVVQAFQHRVDDGGQHGHGPFVA